MRQTTQPFTLLRHFRSIRLGRRCRTAAGTHLFGVGDRIVIRNVGGEAHSFTETPEFGGGCVDELNIPLELSADPRCPGLFGTLIGPGQTQTISGLSEGTHRFFCVIHPWMQATVDVES